MNITPFLMVGAALFAIGFYGALVRRNAVMIMMAIELMLAGVLVNAVAFGAMHGSASGQVFALFVIGIAAAEVGIGLAIIMMIARERRSVDVDELKDMRG